MERVETIARAMSPRGELALRRRDGEDGEPVFELRVNGRIVMDSAETTTERQLAEVALRAVAAPRRILVGGLGLGFTLAAVRDEPRVEEVVVAELEPVVAEWVRAGHVTATADVLYDTRVVLELDDVREVVRRQPAASLDVVLLDVDNGPDALVFDDNAAVYTESFLTECAQRLSPGGALAVWSAAPSPGLERSLAAACGRCRELHLGVRLQRRPTTYHLYLGRRS